MFDHDTHIPIGFDLPWVLALLFLIGFYTNTLNFDQKNVPPAQPSNNNQLEVFLSSKNTGRYVFFSNGQISLQGSFKSSRDLIAQVGGEDIDRGYIDTDNLNLSLADLTSFKENIPLNMKVYHVR